MKPSDTLNDELRSRLLDAIFAVIRANESLAASSKMFPSLEVGAGHLDPKTAVNLYTDAIEKGLESLCMMIDDDEEEGDAS